MLAHDDLAVARRRNRRLDEAEIGRGNLVDRSGVEEDRLIQSSYEVLMLRQGRRASLYENEASRFPMFRAKAAQAPMR